MGSDNAAPARAEMTSMKSASRLANIMLRWGLGKGRDIRRQVRNTRMPMGIKSNSSNGCSNVSISLSFRLLLALQTFCYLCDALPYGFILCHHLVL